MEIRKAIPKDIPGILKLLVQVNAVHHEGRPDLFNKGTKYSAQQLEELLREEDKPILVAIDGETVLGYAFCALQLPGEDVMLTKIKTLYIDDLCVEETCRGQHIGTQLYQAALQLAKQLGCYHLTLNVWQLNPGAMKFYQACGMKPLKTYMEQIIE